MKLEQTDKEEKLFYRPEELVRMGIPRVKAYEIARQVGRKSSEAKRGAHYLVTLEEVKRFW